MSKERALSLVLGMALIASLFLVAAGSTATGAPSALHAGTDLVPTLPPPSDPHAEASPSSNALSPLAQNAGAVPTGEIFRVEQCPELCDYPAIHNGRVVYEDHRGRGIEIYGWDLNTNSEFRVIDDPPHQHFPVIHGDVVVYTDLRFSTKGLDGLDVFAQRLSTGEEFQVTIAEGQQAELAIGPRHIVWEDDRDGRTGSNSGSNRDIYGYDLVTEREFPIATGPERQVQPDVHGYRVVWQEDRRIVGRDYSSGTDIVVPGPEGYRSRPTVNAELIIWEQYAFDWDAGTWESDLYAYRFATGEVFPLVEAPGNQQRPDISDSLVVWEDDRHGNADIYAYDLERGTEFAVTRNARKQKWPAVDGNTIVWSDFVELEPQIYGFIYDGEPPPGTAFAIENNPTGLMVGAFPGGEIRLSWQDNTDEERRYVVERNSGGMLGAGCEVLAILPADTEAYVDNATSVHTPYWYRVYALGSGGRSATSNESYNLALPAGPFPNEQERYMHVLINEVRADPAAFGYGDYAAQPPLVYDQNLNYAARAHAAVTIMPGGSGGHVDWADRGPGDRAVASGFEHRFVSENMAAYGGTAARDVERVHESFLNSYGHRNNMLVAGPTEVGLGYFYLAAEDQGSWVETFAGDSDLVIPYLPAGAVAPFAGVSGSRFSYIVNYYHPHGVAPSAAEVVVDGVPHAMTRSTGTAGNATYRYSQVLHSGDHRYYFRFVLPEGTVRLPEAGAYAGPVVTSGGAMNDGGGSGARLAASPPPARGPIPASALQLPFQIYIPAIFGVPPSCEEW
ncbi:MAG: CAP domain-containing protein [Candidatus Promineifilaceae bacterium]|nr:CAP domain-containing protein [Candidatus Promineifilaceae bacterium]